MQGKTHLCEVGLIVTGGQEREGSEKVFPF